MGLISRQKLLDRDINTRDAMLFVIATEGAATEKDYFEAFNVPRPFSRSRVRVAVIPPLDNRSAPQHVLQHIQDFLKQQKLDARDEVWIVLDVDAWPEHALAKVCAAAKKVGIQVAVSHPCFEVWLCLHFESCGDDDIKKIAVGRDAAQKLKRLWRRHLPRNATQIERTVLHPFTKEACRRARVTDSGDLDAAHPWPAAPGTRVYRLVERIEELLSE